MFSVFSALGLNVGIHPIIENRAGRMGGLSAYELLNGPTVAREGDLVENCLNDLAQKNDDDEDDDSFVDDDKAEGTDHQPNVPKRIYLNRKLR